MKLDRLQERIEFHRERIRAYELVLEDMNGHLTERATDRLPAKLQQAIQLRQAVSSHRLTNRDAAVQERRAILQAFIQPDQTYRMIDFMKVLKARGYVPGAKTMHMDLHALGVTSNGSRVWSMGTAAPPAAAASQKKTEKKQTARFSKNAKQQRKQTAKLLAKLEKMDQPFPSTAFGLKGSVLLRHGYIKKDGDGYARTEKQFTV